MDEKKPPNVEMLVPQCFNCKYYRYFALSTVIKKKTSDGRCKLTKELKNGGDSCDKFEVR